MRRDDRKRNSVTEEDIIMEIAAVASRESAIRKFERIVNDPDVPDLSPEVAASLHKDVMADFARYRKKQARKKSARRAVRIAACFVVVVVSISFVLFQVDAARVAIVNYVIKTFPQYSEIHYDVESNAYPPLGWKSPYYPTWLPEGTKVTQIQITDQKDYYVWFKDKDGYEFHFAVLPVTSGIPAFDSENMTPSKTIVMGYNAIMSYDEERNTRTLVIPTLDQVFMIRGQISESESIKIGDSIRKT